MLRVTELWNSAHLRVVDRYATSGVTMRVKLAPWSYISRTTCQCDIPDTSRMARYFFNSLWHNDATWWQGSGSILAQAIGTGNGLLPDNTKPLTNPMLNNHQWGPMTFIWEQFPKPSSAISYYLENYLHQCSFKPPRDQWVNARWELQQARGIRKRQMCLRNS